MTTIRELCNIHGHDFTMTSDVNDPISTWICEDCDYEVYGDQMKPIEERNK
jgi:uncharacterized protein YlaI